MQSKSVKPRTPVANHRFWLIFFGLMLFFAASVVFYVWRALRPIPPAPEALSALSSDAAVSVEARDWGYLMKPTHNTAQLGLAFYPGARVDYRAYAPVLRQIAAAGYPVALMWVPFNLAITDQDRAKVVLEGYPQLRWVLAGHSMGGVAASNFASSDDPAVRRSVVGLILWASYPQYDLSGLTLPTLALFGSKDGLIPAEKRALEVPRMPKGTRVEVLEGLNHAAFGAYGAQAGDQPADLPQAEGWEQIARASIEFLQQVDSR
ncbi:alpha/beta hydrolase [Calidithermus timidus]|uniref:alpha/beta hydrolase n=1 Tax=Calidithermus timidus TaxID=307124 RepID=UPI0003A4D2BB|nr:alpha/beta hydrolase [Calidithermus timidus]